MWDWISKLAGSSGGGVGSGSGSGYGGIGSAFDQMGSGTSIGSMYGAGGSGGGMGSMMSSSPSSSGGVDQGAIEAQKYKSFMDMMNSPAAQQSRGQNFSSQSDDKAFALTEGQRSYHDLFEPGLSMQGIASMVQGFSPPPQPFQRGMNDFGALQNGGAPGSGYDLIKQLLGKRQ